MVTWNCRGLKNKIPELQQISKEYDIIILTELKCKQVEKISIPGFNCYSDLGTSFRTIKEKKILIFQTKKITIHFIITLIII